MKKIIIILSLGIFFYACDEEEITVDDKILNTSIFKRSNSEPLAVSDGQFNIDNAALNDNTWTFVISHSGGCDPKYNFVFQHTPKLTADCVSDTIHVALKTADNCKRLDNTTVNVNLNNYKICGKKLYFVGGTKVLEIAR